MFVGRCAISACMGDAHSQCSAKFRLLASRILGMVGFRSDIHISLRSGLFNTGGERAWKIAERSLQSLQRRNAVVFLKLGRFGGDLRRIKLDLFRIFFGLDFDETFDWMLHRFRQIV